MADFAALLNTLPEPLRLQVEFAWSDFAAKAGNRALPAEILDALPRVWAASPFVAGHCSRRPERLFDLADSGRLLRVNRAEEYRGLLRRTLEGVAGEPELMAALRRFRNREMVRIAWRDIAGWAPLDETLRDVSLLAETCVQETLDFLFCQACALRGTPVDRDGRAQSLVVLGMGKLGAWELNFSSDIDLIFAYRDDGTLPDKKETSYAEFYTRLARSLIKVLDAVTEDGFAFRTDARLRPFGDSGPLVLSFDAMEAYYQAQAREWERYAMVKARTIAGDFEAGRELEEFLRPFVYRRYLDFRALGELRALKQKISAELQRKDRQENVKLGPGGIREIEFIGQAFQLIRGGHEKKLRDRRIRAVLDALAELNLMPAETVATLQRAYAYLRTVENRLQQYADRQTHDLPSAPAERLALAYALGHDGWESFKAELDAIRSEVHGIFLQVIAPTHGEDRQVLAIDGDSEKLAAALLTLGWSPADAEKAAGLLQQFHGSRAVHQLTQRGDTELKRLLPLLLGATARADEPVETLERLLALLEAIASRNVYLTLLAENPPALAHLVKLAGASPWIVHHIARFPLLLDELLDPRTLYTPLTKAELKQELARKLESVDANDLEQLMVALRRFKQANVLRIAAADLSGAIPIMVVSDYLTWTAEVLVDEILRQAWLSTAEKHGVPPGARLTEPDGFAVVAYGKLGGIELGYGSDLDLVFLYEGTDTALTNGPKPISSAEFFSRTAKRIIHLLTTKTSAGMLYEVDLRLRPSGSSGLLVSSVEAYENYQMQNAWTWEQQALCKARCVAGDAKVGEKFGAIRARSLGRTRDTASLRTEVREMREKMRETLGAGNPALFHLKQDFGGIVDIEFLVQFAVLSGAQQHAELTQWTDVVRQLDSLTAAGFLGADAAALLRQAYCSYRERTHRAALQETAPVVPADEFAKLRAAVQQIWRDVMEC
jgi:glutamate-ammonia-ligase adenylyltransferase